MPDVTATWGQPESSLPSLTRKDTLKRYRMRIEGVKSWREQEHYEKTWDRLRDIYRLKSYEASSDDDRIVVAVAFATINVIEPSIAINYPKFTVAATQQEEDAQATIAEAAVNYWWRHYDFQPQLRRGAKDFLIYGHGWLKVAYRYVEGQQPIHPDALAQAHAELAAQHDQHAIDHPETAHLLPSDEEIAAMLPTHEPVVLEDRPFVERISPFDMFVDPEATDLSDARWVAQRIIRPIEEVKADPRYKPSVRKDLESDGSVKWQNSKSPYHVEVEAGRISLWEFYDLVRKTMCVFAETGEAFLIDPVPMPYTYGLPFVMIRDYDVPDQFYPIGELEALEPLQNEINETRTAMVRARKESIRKYLYHAEAFGAEGLAAIRSDKDNTAVPVNNSTPLEQAIKPMEQVPVNVELYKHSDVILADLDRVSGVSEYQRGELPEIRRTATEASIIQDAANSRAADKLATIELALAHVGRRLLMLAQEYMTGDQTLRKTGVDGTHVWVQFKREDIQGEFDFSVEAGSTTPNNDTFRRQQAIQMAQMLTPFMAEGVIDPRMLVEHLLRDGFNIKSADKFILPPQPQKQQGPMDKMIETMAYKDAPPDIQRQMERQAGLVPSAIGNAPSPTAPAPGTPPAPGSEIPKEASGQPHPQVPKPKGDPAQNGGGAQGPQGA